MNNAVRHLVRYGANPMLLVLATVLPTLILAAPAAGFERATHADYNRFAYCYGQQVGAAIGLADDLMRWERAYPEPEGESVEIIGMARARAVELSTLADTTAALFEDLDHPGYGMDRQATNAAYEQGYAFWADYMGIRFNRRIQIEVPDSMMGISPECWDITFRIEALHKANADSGELVWEE